jgi:deoxyribodipyrimidine photo-lyase
MQFKHQGTEHVILFHDEMLSPNNPLYQRSQKKVFIFDAFYYKDWALKRLQFLADCLTEMPEVEVWVGDTLDVLTQLNAGSVETQNTPNTIIRNLLSSCNVSYFDEPAIYAEMTKQKLNAKGVVRFSKYWNEVGAEILRHE